MSLFQEKIIAACTKKEALFQESLGRYALRSLFAGAFLTMTTAVGIIGADTISSQFPALAKFVFTFLFAIGLVYVLIFNGELATSNMMYLTAGAYYKVIDWKKAIIILLYCTFFNLIGAIIFAWLFNQSYAFSHLTEQSFVINTVQTKLAKNNGMAFIEGITANIFVNMAILGYMLLKEEYAKFFIVVSAIFMFVLISNEHLIANFASFMLAGLSPVETIKGFNFGNILRQWTFVFFGNWVGGGLCIGLAYAWLNQTQTNHHE
ncbi:formate/nitrite transporter family protein [Streptococcus acidominimus]|uniref:Formate/nitrite transporter family protein n=1 Tax=Streptococcus acidominimus TaxID=1326 RepID=A0A239WIQ7_STRAI|nr:formate/nitrite transporter family protein [Streptococcus acidominimus]SNV34006.1 formate/nitrite transporter family protein [Streptococcus acidominimus]